MMSTKEICRVPWVRDEVILILAVVLCSKKNTYPVDSTECQELSRQLHALPIVPLDKRVSSFRNTTEMKMQLEKLSILLYNGKISGHTNNLFATVLNDFKDSTELLLIASSIIINTAFAIKIPWIFSENSNIQRRCFAGRNSLLS